METYTHTDPRIVLTLDAGGTNLVFAAIRGGEEIVPPVTLPSVVDDLNACLTLLLKGFEQVRQSLPEPPAAISFAFPGPADYCAGIIGDLPNFPAFRGGVALGPFLEAHFGLPVYINNDGNLFAYGEALAGRLPEINRQLEAAGSTKRYRNLIGVTLGTGFGGGIVINGELLFGDNQTGGYLWCQRNHLHPDFIAEESVSIRAVKRVYAECSGDTTDYTPADIYHIAEGSRQGDRLAALLSFSQLGKAAGGVLSAALALVDGLVVIGGGLTGASQYILPALMEELNQQTGMMGGSRFNRLPMKPYNLEDSEELAAFLQSSSYPVAIPGTDRQVDYDPFRRTGIAISYLGASRSIALGAYWFALKQLDKQYEQLNK